MQPCGAGACGPAAWLSRPRTLRAALVCGLPLLLTATAAGATADAATITATADATTITPKATAATVLVPQSPSLLLYCFDYYHHSLY